MKIILFLLPIMAHAAIFTKDKSGAENITSQAATSIGSTVPPYMNSHIL